MSFKIKKKKNGLCSINASLYKLKKKKRDQFINPQDLSLLCKGIICFSIMVVLSRLLRQPFRAFLFLFSTIFHAFHDSTFKLHVGISLTNQWVELGVSTFLLFKPINQTRTQCHPTNCTMIIAINHVQSRCSGPHRN